MEYDNVVDSLLKSMFLNFTWQWYGVSPVCKRSCTVKLPRNAKLLSHTKHLCFLTPEWTREWPFRWPICKSTKSTKWIHRSNSVLKKHYLSKLCKTNVACIRFGAGVNENVTSEWLFKCKLLLTMWTAAWKMISEVRIYKQNSRCDDGYTCRVSLLYESLYAIYVMPLSSTSCHKDYTQNTFSPCLLVSSSDTFWNCVALVVNGVFCVSLSSR